MPDLPAGYVDVVRRNHATTTGFLWAMQVACRDIVDQELQRIQRRLKAVEPGSLDEVGLPASWLLAVLLCPGDDTAEAARWVRARPPADRERVRFYLRPRTSEEQAFRAWLEAGLGAPLATDVRDFSSFHRAFGRHLNDRVWLDHRSG